MALGLTQPLTEMSTKNLRGGKGRLARKAWQPHRHLWDDCLENVGSLDVSQPYGPLRPVTRTVLPFTWVYLAKSTLRTFCIFRAISRYNAEVKTTISNPDDGDRDDVRNTENGSILRRLMTRKDYSRVTLLRTLCFKQISTLFIYYYISSVMTPQSSRRVLQKLVFTYQTTRCHKPRDQYGRAQCYSTELKAQENETTKTNKRKWIQNSDSNYYEHLGRQIDNRTTTFKIQARCVIKGADIFDLNIITLVRTLRATYLNPCLIYKLAYTINLITKTTLSL
jgi:hypothetical protein